MARQWMLPGYAFINEASTRQWMLPGYAFINEIGAAPPTGWEFDEAIRPNAVTLINLTGSHTDIDDDPTTPDSNWITVS